MSYMRSNRRGRRGMSGLGDVSNCGTDQVWDPNVSFYGIKGQCMPRSSYTASQLVDPNAVPGVVKSSSSSGAGDIIKGIFGALTAPAVPTTPIYVAPTSGMSDTAKIAIAGGAALVVVALLANRD